MAVLALPPFTPASIVSAASLDSWLTIGLVVSASLYLFGVQKMRLRGDKWPLNRTLFFLIGLGIIGIAALSGLAAYDDTLFSAHMVQHMLLSMVAPIFLALGAPVTLALRTLSGSPRRWLLAALHSRVAKVVMFPLVAFALFVASPYALYFSGLYEATLENRFLHEWLHIHFLVVGCAFFWPLVGLDPLPGRWPYPARGLLMVLSMPIHAILGLTIMNSATLLAEEHYVALNEPWLNIASQQQIGGGLLWASGDIISLIMLGALVVQWIRASEREAARIDRELDRREAAGETLLSSVSTPQRVHEIV